ncbi:MAG TPA: hypothetical protein VFG23_06175 [Polyangia bacterium]|nr:hypothetical protein [Polyangia bacterium]
MVMFLRGAWDRANQITRAEQGRDSSQQKDVDDDLRTSAKQPDIGRCSRRFVSQLCEGRHHGVELSLAQPKGRPQNIGLENLEHLLHQLVSRGDGRFVERTEELPDRPEPLAGRPPFFSRRASGRAIVDQSEARVPTGHDLEKRWRRHHPVLVHGC